MALITYKVTNPCGSAEDYHSIAVMERRYCHEGVDDAGATAPAVFPNPANETVTITATSGITTATITDMVGRSLQSASPRTNSTTIDVRNLPAGTYLLKMQVNGRMYHEKLLIAR